MVSQIFEEIVALPGETLSFVFRIQSLLSCIQIHHLTNRIEMWLGKSKNSQSQKRCHSPRAQRRLFTGAIAQSETNLSNRTCLIDKIKHLVVLIKFCSLHTVVLE